jgi:hypothetical protein
MLILAVVAAVVASNVGRARHPRAYGPSQRPLLRTCGGVGSLPARCSSTSPSRSGSALAGDLAELLRAVRSCSGFSRRASQPCLSLDDADRSDRFCAFPVLGDGSRRSPSSTSCWPDSSSPWRCSAFRSGFLRSGQGDKFGERWTGAASLVKALCMRDAGLMRPST